VPGNGADDLSVCTDTKRECWKKCAKKFHHRAFRLVEKRIGLQMKKVFPWPATSPFDRLNFCPG